MILMKFENEIKGDSVVDGHDGWITVDSFQFGVGRAISASGGGKDRDTSNPSFSEITVTKSTDIASSELFMQAICGKSLGKATFHFIQTSGDQLQNYLIYDLHDAIVSSYSLSSGGERPSESVALNYVKIEMTYNQFSGKDVAEGKPKKWDLAANKMF